MASRYIVKCFFMMMIPFNHQLFFLVVSRIFSRAWTIMICRFGALWLYLPQTLRRRESCSSLTTKPRLLIQAYICYLTLITKSRRSNIPITFNKKTLLALSQAFSLLCFCIFTECIASCIMVITSPMYFLDKNSSNTSMMTLPRVLLTLLDITFITALAHRYGYKPLSREIFILF